MAQTRFAPTLFERLFDEQPGSPADHLIRGWSLEQLKDSVATDVEALLNSRCAFPAARLADYREARSSVLSYGMVDFVGLSLANPNDREQICRSIAVTITEHEPRLQHVQVRLTLDDSTTHRLHFAIQALLVANPASEPVSFDALLQPATQQYSVSRPRRAVNIA